MDIEQIKRLTDTVQGWLTHCEGKVLYKVAKNCKGEGVIVEIGSWKGKSTIWIGYGSKSGNRVVCSQLTPTLGYSNIMKKALKSGHLRNSRITLNLLN